MLYIQRTDTGVNFVVTLLDEQTNQILNISSATNINFIFRRPDKVTYIVDGSLYTDGTDGKVQYTSQPSDMTVAGLWKFQVSYQLNGATKLSSYTTFQVSSNLIDLA